ncbi:MAG: isochorismatase family protein [Alphaproteobacteria bacterium]|nr:isochorismatase family protein [Alphaproteobacteria bacterium]
MSIINFRAYANPRTVPTLVLVDLQQEYVSPPRALALEGAPAALEQCRMALAHARDCGFPVAFLRWVDNAPFFNPNSRFARWIEGFEPYGSDMIFERNRPSCYAAREFAEFMGKSGQPFVLAGFAGETACLSTAIDAFHRGHSFTFLQDASASHRLDNTDAEGAHSAVADIIRLYGEVLDTRSWINATQFAHIRASND